MPALIAVGGMFASTLPSVEFSRNMNLVFLVFAALAGLGWFTREKNTAADVTQNEKDLTKEINPAQISSESIIKQSEDKNNGKE